jgi:hypothetical protein
MERYKNTNNTQRCSGLRQKTNTGRYLQEQRYKRITTYYKQVFEPAETIECAIDEDRELVVLELTGKFQR